MNTVQVGLLIKDAGRHEWKNRTVIVTANGQVTFAYGQDHNTGMQFTIDQWNEIVQFVESQLDAVGDKAQPSWGPDWSKIDERYKFYAVDQSGFAHAYTTKPDNERWSDEWCNTEFGGYIKLGRVILPHGVKWRDTLLTRPIQTPKHANCPCHTS